MEKLRAFYESLYQTYGRDEKALSWSKHKQEIRFEQLFRFFPSTRGASVLDIGCGFGDLFAYWKRECPWGGDYCGVDLVPAFIEEARTVFGTQSGARFMCGDFMKDTVLRAERFSYVVASGIFGVQTEENEDAQYAYIDRVFERALRVSTVGIAMDFLSDKVDYRTGAYNFHANPSRILELAYRHSRNVILDNSVMPFEFTLTIMKNDAFSTETTVFDMYFEHAKGAR